MVDRGGSKPPPRAQCASCPRHSGLWYRTVWPTNPWLDVLAQRAGTLKPPTAERRARTDDVRTVTDEGVFRGPAS